VVGNAMLLDQCDEVRGRIMSQRRLREVRVRRDKIARLTVEVCEITAAAAGDENLLANTICAFKNCDAAPAFAGLQRAQESGRAAAENQGIIGFDQGGAPGTRVTGTR